MSIIITLIIFCIIVVIHEFGHFITAKKCGVEVPEFAVGMGPKIFSLKKGETLYSLRLFPIGGFCRLKGETTGEGSGSFVEASLIKRILIVCAGSFMNLLLAIFVFIIISSFTAIPTSEIKDFSENSPAKEAGILKGDKIIAINNQTVYNSNDIRFILSDYKGGSLSVKVNRNSKNYTYTFKPVKSENGGFLLGIVTNSKSPLFGKQISETQQANIFDVVSDGIYNTFFSVKVTVVGLIRLVTANLSINDVSGPIGFTGVVDEIYTKATNYGLLVVILQMLQITGLLSANLCVMNMLPIPALDGGRFLFLLIEALRGKPIPPEKEGVVHFIGFAVLILLGIVIALNDINKFF